MNTVISDRCSNIEFLNTLSRHRSTQELTKEEKKYGMICNKCQTLINEVHNIIIECINCGALVSIINTSKKNSSKVGYCLQCRLCIGTRNDEKIITTNNFQIIIFKSLDKIGKWSKKKERKKKNIT